MLGIPTYLVVLAENALQVTMCKKHIAYSFIP